MFIMGNHGSYLQTKKSLSIYNDVYKQPLAQLADYSRLWLLILLEKQPQIMRVINFG